MNEAEKYAINEMQRELESALSLTFLKQFMDKIKLKLEDKNRIMKLRKENGQTKQFLSCIQKVPGAFSILVEKLKKERNKKCPLLACQLESRKKTYDQEQKRKENQQDKLSQQISDHLALVVNGAKIQCTGPLSLPEQVNEHEKLIKKLEVMRRDLEYQEGMMEQPVSLPQLVETKCHRLEKRANEEMQSALDAQKEVKDLKLRYEDMTSKNEKIQEDLAEEIDKLKNELANIKVWQQRSDEETKKLIKEKEHLEMRRREENKKLQKQKQKYKSLKELCHCGAVKHKQAVDLEDNDQKSCNQGNQVASPGHMDTDVCVFSQPQLQVDTDRCGFSQPQTQVDTDGCGFSQPQPRNQQEYVEERPPSGSSSSATDQSAISNINLQDNNVNKSTNVFLKNVKNFYVIQN